MEIISFKKYIDAEENKAREREVKIKPLIDMLHENLPILATIPEATDERSEAQQKAYWIALKAVVELRTLGLERLEIRERVKPELQETLRKWYYRPMD